MKKSIITSILVLAGTVWAGTYSGGLGTEANPYQISTVQDWLELRGTSADWDKHFVLMNDINFGGVEISPVAPDTDSTKWSFDGPTFCGVFDGNGKVLSNFVLLQPENNYLGLFGCIGTGGLVNNLGLESISIFGNNIVGGLCGRNEGTIIGCYVTGSVEGNKDDVQLYLAIHTDYVGGLVGINVGTVIQSYAAGTVMGNCNVGGLCGRNVGTVSQCYATGSVTSRYYGGGLVGENYGGIVSTGRIVSNSFWNIETSGQQTSAGGMGLSSAEMKESFYYSTNGWGGDVWILDSGNDYPHLAWENTGGSFITDPIVSMVGSGSVEDPWIIASKEDFLYVCSGTFFWDKHYLLTTDIDLAGSTYSGALIGYDKGNSFTGTFDGNGFIIRNLTLEGGAYLGLFGFLGQGALITSLGVENISVSGTGSYVGGLVAYNNSGSLSGCYVTGSVRGFSNTGGVVGYNSGTLTACYVTGAVNGSSNSSNVGGLVGWNNGGTIAQCYAVGAMTGPVHNTGGLVGRNDSGGIVSNSFWDTETSGRGFSSGGTGMSTVKMKDINTFLSAGWDFIDEAINGTEDTWRMIFNSYPIHSWTEGFVLSVANLEIEEGQIATFEIVLPDEPLTEVTIHLSILGDPVFELLSANTLVFNHSNWHIPQVVSVRANLDDNYFNDTATLVLQSRGYRFELHLQEIDIQPEPTYDVIIVSNENVIVHRGSQSCFTVKLAEDPLRSVWINLTISGDPEISINFRTVLHFNSSNYSVPQIVTVRSLPGASKYDTQAEIKLSTPSLNDRLSKTVLINKLARKPFRLSKPPVWLDLYESKQATSFSSEIKGLFTNPSDATWHKVRVASRGGVPAVKGTPGKYKLVMRSRIVGNVWYNWSEKIWVPGTPGTRGIPAKNRARINFTNESSQSSSVWVSVYEQVESGYKLVKAKGIKPGKTFKFLKDADVDYYIRITPAFSDLGAYKVGVTTEAVR